MSVKVGLTGLWGSGKTTVLKMFQDLGAAVLDLDDVVHQLLQEPVIVERLCRVFGPEIAPEGRIHPKALARKAFESEKQKEALERIIHPEVFKQMIQFLDTTSGVAVVEVPLLFETSSEKYFDRTIVVTAREDTRRHRLLQKGYSPEEISQRLRYQLPEEEKLRRAHYVIDNSGPLEETKKQALRIWEDLQNL